METLFARGIEQFNRGEFFECHETLEDYWNGLHGDEKLFIQGLIQAAVACYHALNGNWRGAASQYDKSIAKLERFLPSRSGIELGQLVMELRACRDALCMPALERASADNSDVFPVKLIPRIKTVVNE